MDSRSPAERLRDTADDVRREAKSIQRRMRVLTQLAAQLEADAAEVADAAEPVSQHPVD